MSLSPLSEPTNPPGRTSRRAVPGDRRGSRGRIRSLGLLAAFVTLALAGLATAAAAGALSFAPAVNNGDHAAFASSDGYVASARSAASNTCTRALASRVATRLHVGVDPILHKTPIFQVLCGPFFGPASRGMAASVAVPTGCGGSIGWAVFRYAAGRWRLVMQQRNGAFLAKAGSDIRERRGDPRRGDPHCAPSAWKTRIWHWNGHRLTASAWKVTQAMSDFLSPDRKVWCSVDDFAHEMFCATRFDPEHSGTLKRNGTVTICNATSPGDVCTQNWHDRADVLRYGQTNELSGFRCLSETKGITCTVISGAGKGKGFMINSSGVTRVGP